MAVHKSRLSAIVAFSFTLVLLASCATPAGQQQRGADVDLRSRLIAANLMSGSLAEGLNSAIIAHAVTPGSDEALLITATLEAVERSLDGAGTALRAGLPDMATRQIAAAESQLEGLQPLLPIQNQPDVTGDVP